MGKSRIRFNEKGRQSKRSSVKPQKYGSGVSEIQNAEYQASPMQIPELILMHSTKTNDEPTPFLTTVQQLRKEKMSSRKKKRLDKFIERELRKETKAKLLDKLAGQHFDAAELLMSSKKLGKGNLTMKESLRQSLLEHRRGVPQSDHSVRLVVEKDFPAIEEDDEIDMDVPECDVEKPQPPVGIVSLAFGSAEPQIEPGKPELDSVFVSNELGEVIGVEERRKPVKGSALRSVGAALKRKIVDSSKEGSTEPIVTESANLQDNTKRQKQVESGNESSDDEPDKRTQGLWSIDAVNGEASNVVQHPKPQHKPAEPKIFDMKTEPSCQKAIFVPVHRPEEIQISRMQLPVVAEEQPIMECIMKSDVTILCGETGSGKTTQVPQFLFEAGFAHESHPLFKGMIGVTQPRRVAAVSMAKRVATEMGLSNGEVAYQIRYDKSSVRQNTKIKFMTDGVLLRALSGGVTPGNANDDSDFKSDILLSDYSCIIIDEAHERTIGTDVLIGWLTRIVRLRNSGKLSNVLPLRLIIMSATLRVEDFTLNSTLFPEIKNGLNAPPIMKVDGRQHRVVVHYNRKTPEEDYITEALKKVVKIHTKLPPGGILVFVTGQQEVQTLVKKLSAKFPTKSSGASGKIAQKHELSDEPPEDSPLFTEAEAVEDLEEPVTQLDDFENMDSLKDDEDDDEDEVQILGGTINDDSGDNDQEEMDSYVPPEDVPPVYALPLYSLLPTAAQLKVFDKPPEGSRLIVVATNVAETSITIPGIRYVVDCGKAKERRYDPVSGMYTFQIGWTCKASADQRAGRAGRMGPGHCYRLYSSAVFDQYFESFSKPEILRTPIEDVVLQMKAMGIQNIVGFPFPTCPDKSHLESAEQLLTNLGALRPKESKRDVLEITNIGRRMAMVPVSPRLAKILAVASKESCEILEYMIAIVAGLSVGEPFVRDCERTLNEQEEREDDGEDERKKERARFFKIMQLYSGTNPTSDMLRLLTAIGAYTMEHQRLCRTNTSRAVMENGLKDFCHRHFLRHKAMDEIRKLQSQLIRILKQQFSAEKGVQELTDYQLPPSASKGEGRKVQHTMKPPNAQQQAIIRELILTGYPDRIARLSDTAVSGFGKEAKPVYETMVMTKDIAANGHQPHYIIHPTSSLFRVRPAPKWIVFGEMMGREERMTADGQGKHERKVNSDASLTPQRHWLKGCTVIHESWIPVVCPSSICRTGAILDQPEPRYDAKRDQVVAYVTPIVGPYLWELGMIETTQLEADKRAVWFAKALLEGLVLGKPAVSGHTVVGKKPNADKDFFGHLASFYITKPSVMAKSWSRHQKRVTHFLNELLSPPEASSTENSASLTKSSYVLCSRKALFERWSVEPHFLIEAVKQWVPEDIHPLIVSMWPPMRQNKSWIDAAVAQKLQK